MNVFDVEPDDPLGLPGERRVKRGDPQASGLWARTVRLGDERMPPLSSLRADQAGADLLAEWIAQTPNPTQNAATP